MIKLTDMQLILLTTAWQRDDGSLLPPPESLGDKQAAIHKTIEGIIKKGFAAEKEGMTAAQAWRTDGDLTFGVVITEAGIATINPSPDAVEGTDGTDKLADHGLTPKPPRASSKRSLLLDLLKREGGATLGDIIEATGWLPHSSRAALTGLRQNGHDIASTKVEGVTRYQIATAA
ncbi:DUF3489 domain-containing protein [Rhizorhabdus wittichii]|uniref:DUF3489 domain-containing protein n=1 Tax=Rhizorhabdus wittichii TaxID=160791 RepID=UPI0002E5EEC3|nr:DUF3489 domain-containing protein [Rhizorhabdus wittichii]